MEELKRAGVPRLIAAVLLCQATGGLGAFATIRSVNTWYREIEKPSFTPPDWVFGPVWTVLYTLMGIAAGIISANDGDKRQRQVALSVFGVQLTFNALWSVFFFGRRSPIAALIDLILLGISLVSTIVLFFRISKLAALLLIPYLAWVIFAGALNGSVWWMNR